MAPSNSVHRWGGRGKSQGGMTLLEVILGLSVLALVTIGLNQLSDRWADDTKNTVAASQVRTFGEAVQSYIKDNYAAVQGVATATAPAIIDVPTLIAAQKLPAAYQNSNAYGQATCALVLEPATNRLQAMVITEGGKTVGDPSLATVAATTGGSGGGVYSTDTINIKGAVGGWQLATSTYDNLANNLGKRCDGSAGNVRVTVGHPMMALWFENGDVSSAWLARDAVPGRPELNAMNTPLMMNSVQTKGAACTTGAIARAADGSLLTCRTGSWQPASASCLPDATTDLNNLQDDSWCINGIGNPNSPAGGDWFFMEVFRHTNHSIYYVTQRLIGMTGASIGKTWVRSQNAGGQAGGWTGWNQVTDPNVGVGLGSGSVSAAGNIQAGGSVTAGMNVVANSNMQAAGQVSGGTYVYSGGDMYAAATVNGNYVYSRGNVDAAANVNGNYISARAGLRSYSSGDWGVILGDSAGNLNSNPTSYLGSMHVNDIYLRSVGQWASQRGKSMYITGADGGYGTAVASCGANQLVAGSCYGADTCSGNDSSGHGGYPSGNSWVCPYINCTRTYAYATCAY